MFYFIVNPTSRSGRGAQIWQQVKAQLDLKGIAYQAFDTKYKGHATELADKICSQNEDDMILVALGGDGTVNEVINGMKQFDKVRFGVISTGSGNDFARGLGKNEEPLVQLERLLSVQEERRIDLGTVTWDDCENGRYFVVSAGVGLDAIVVKRSLVSRWKVFLNKIHLGKLVYSIVTVFTLFSMTRFGLKGIGRNVCIDGEHADKIQKQFPKTIFVAAMNFPTEGGGIPMAPNAQADDGKLSIACIHGIPKVLTLFCLPVLMAGKQHILKQFDCFDCCEYEIQLSDATTLHMDGECVGETRHVVFGCVPKKLRMIV